MGCDIHLYVERRVDGKWVTADRWTPDKYAEEGETPSMVVEYENSYYRHRNYNLFAILADVRNGRGFAGCKTGEGYVPISEPRGLPPDVCPQVRQVSEEYGVDGHSHSYFTVAEIMDYDWTQVTCLQGWISAVEFERWNRWGRHHGLGPENYCGGVSGSSVKHISLQEMEQRVNAVVKDLLASEREEAVAKLGMVYCLAEWTEPYYIAGATFLSEVLPRLWRLGKPKDVRIVFWFDN